MVPISLSSKLRRLPNILPVVMQRSVLTLLTGSVLGQAITYAARPLLTRLYTPEEFGVLSFFMSIVATLTVVSTGRYDEALMLPARERDAAALFSGAAGLLVMSTVLSLVIVVWRRPVAEFFNQPSFEPFVAAVPAGLFLAGAIRLSEQWLMRHRRFRNVSTRRIIHSGLTVPVQIGLGVAGVGAAGLVGGMLVGYAGAALLLAVVVWRNYGRLLSTASAPARIRSAFGRYRRFATVSVPSSLLNTLSVHLPVLMLLFFFDSAVIGHYGLAVGMLLVPMTLVGNSIGQVFFVHAAEAARDGTIGELTNSLFTRLVLMASFPMLAVVIAGPELFSVVFSSEWREAGVYARYLAIWILIVSIFSPLSRLFDVLERQPAELGFNVLLLVTRIAVIVTGGLVGDARLTIILFSASGAMLWLVMSLWILREAGVPFARARRVLLGALGLNILPLALVLLALLTVSSIMILLSVVVAGLLYLSLVWRYRPALMKAEA